MSGPHSAVKMLGVIGWDEAAQSLVETLSDKHLYPRKNVSLGAWAPLSEDLVTESTQVGPKMDWRAVLGNKNLDFIFLASDAANDKNVLEALTATNTKAVSFLPINSALQDAARNLYVSSSLRASLAGSQGLELIAGGEIGAVLALYIGCRIPKRGDDLSEALRRSLWEALDFTLASVDSAVTRVFYRSAALMGKAQDHLQLLLRFEDDCIATLDLLILEGASEETVEIEITGKEGLLQLRPHSHRVLYGSRAVEGMTDFKSMGWHRPPVVNLIDAFAASDVESNHLITLPKPPFLQLIRQVEERLSVNTEGAFALEY